MSVIANTTILSNFATVKRLELLRRIWKVVYLPDQVYGEIQNGLQAGYSFYDDITTILHPLNQQGWLHLTTLSGSEEFTLYFELQRYLHAGESACLSIAYHRQWTFLSDDRAARTAASNLNVTTGGTIGVLLTLIKAKYIALSEGNALLADMRSAGYYAPVQVLDTLLP